MKIEPMSEEHKKMNIESLHLISFQYQDLEMEQYIKELYEDIALINFSFFMKELEDKQGSGPFGRYLGSIS